MWQCLSDKHGTQGTITLGKQQKTGRDETLLGSTEGETTSHRGDLQTEWNVWQDLRYRCD